MVLMQHTLNVCITGLNESFLFRFLGLVHMPLFFFVSGWFSLKIVDNTYISPRIWKKTKQLVIPMLIVSTIWIFLGPYTSKPSSEHLSFSVLWLDAYKNGYWFTLVLFEIIAVYKLIYPIFIKIRSIYIEVLICFCVWILLLTVTRLLPQNIGAISSVALTAKYFVVYMIGVLCSKHRKSFFNLLESDKIRTISILVFLATLLNNTIFSNSYDFHYGYLITSSLFYASFVFVAVCLFKQWSESAFNPNREIPGKFARIWQYVGQHSLAIYFIHFFLLYPLTSLRLSLQEMDMALVPMLVVSVVNASVITTLSLLINYLLCRSNFVAKYIFSK